jgi:hypothetical protein
LYRYKFYGIKNTKSHKTNKLGAFDIVVFMNVKRLEHKENIMLCSFGLKLFPREPKKILFSLG